MAVNPMIALGAQVGDFDFTRQRLMDSQRRTLQQEAKMRDAAMRQEAETVELLKKYGSDITPETINQVMSVNPRAAATMQGVLTKQTEDARKAQESQVKIEADKLKLDTDKFNAEMKQAEVISNALSGVKDEAGYFRALRMAAAQGVRSEALEQLAQDGYDPQRVSEFATQFQSAKERAEFQKTLQQLRRDEEMDPLNRQKLEAELLEKTRGEDGLTPGERAAQSAPTNQQKEFKPFYDAWLEANDKPRNAKNELEARKAFFSSQRVPVPGVDVALPAEVEAQKGRIAAAGRAASGAGAPAMSEEGLDMAARSYLQTGQLPARSAALNVQIISRAAELDSSANPMFNRANYDANRRSLTELTRTVNAIEAFEATALANLDIFLDTAKKVIDTGSPLLNKPLRSISSIGGGSEQQAAFETARQVAVNEIAKVLTNPSGNAALTDNARDEVAKLIKGDYTLGQIYAAANVLKNDMENRKRLTNEKLRQIGEQIRTGAAPGTGPDEGKEKPATMRFNPATGRLEAIK